MRIVSWNMNHWRRTPAARKAAWQFLKQLQPDIALLQEAMPDEEVPFPYLVFRSGGIGKSRPWGSAVVSFSAPAVAITEARSRYSKKPCDLHATFLGSLAIARVGELTVISHYGLIHDSYAVTTVHRQLSDLTPLFDSPLGKRVVLGGDLNLSTQLDEPHRSRHRNLLDRFACFGLVDCLALNRPPRPPLENCPCGDSPCSHVRTQRHGRSRTPWQNDYIFVSKSLRSAVKGCFPLDRGDPDPWQLSDHCPLILDMDIELPNKAVYPIGPP